MSKKIELTWRNKNKVITEECWLVDDTDPVYFGDSEPMVIVTESGVGHTVETIANGMVVFEDALGLFMVPPQDVIFIKEIE